MPSSEFIEIDIADNDVAILDASCVLSSSHQAEEMAGKAGRVSQTQESQVASPARMGMCGNLDGFKGAAVIDTESTPIKSPPSIRKKAHKLDATPARPRAKKATSKGNARAPTAVILRGRKNVTSTSAEKCTDDDAKKAETDVMKAATMSPTKSTSTVAVATPVKEESDVNLKNRVSPYGKSNCGGKKKTKSNTTSHITSESTKPIKTLFSFFGPAKGVEANVANKSSDQKPMATSTMSLNNDTTVQIVKRVECEKTEVKMDLNHKSIFSDKAVRVAQIGVDVSKDKSSVTDAITSKSVKEVTAMDRVKKAPVKKKKCSNVQTNNDITKIDDMTLDSLKSAPTAKNSFFNTATSLLLNNISASTEDSILLSKLDGSPVEAVAFASRSSSASRNKKRRTYYGPIFSKCSGTIVVDACDPASTVESDIKLELRKASIEEVQEGKVEDFEKKKSEIIVAISVNKSNDDQSRASKSDNSLIEEASSNKDKPKSGDTNQTTCTQKQDALNTQEADDDATVDLEDIPLEMKAAIDSSSPDDDDHDNADDVPLEIEGMGCVLVVEDDMTHGSSDDMKCESANKMGMKDAAVENKEVVNPSNNQVQRKTKKRDSLQPSKSPEAKKTSQSIESTYMMTETPKMIAPLAATFKNHANLSAKSSEFVGNKKQVSSPKPSVLITKADEAKQEEGVSLITKHTKVGQDSESKTAARVDARIRSESGTKSSLLSNDVCCRLQQLMMLREKYVTRGIELAARHSSEDFEEERLSLEGVKLGRAEVGEDGDVPDELLKVLLTIIQGSSLPLSSLAKNAMEELAVFTKNPKLLTIEAVSSKIKLLAQRKQYLSGHPQLSLTKAKTKIDCFENEEESFMWRWELSSTDLLPPKEASKVKKARSLRRKLQSHHKSIVNLISSIDKAISWLENNPSATSKLFASTSALAKVSDMEEKVLKFEREEEKARLLLEAKKTAEEARQKQNNLMEEARLLEKKRKQEEKERKKLEAAKDREVAKRNRLEEKEREKTRKRKEMEEKDTKQKARMLSFFARPSQKKKRRVSDTTTNLSISSRDITSAFDSERFRTAIDSQDEHVSNPFDKLSRRSKLAMQSKTSKINVSVFVTVLSDNPFSPQPYDEERVITVPNKYKFLGFHEDIRPPYHGTWSKPVSSTVTGRTPFGKDTQYLDYDIDSEAEWEEDDDDQGEDCDDDAADEEEEVAQNDDEENDGWLAAEDDLGIEEDDEETKELRKKIHSEAKNTSLYSNRFQAAVISPYIGGAVHKVEDISSFVEGIDRDNALEKLSSHIGCILTPELSISLDAFPPPESTENEGPSQSENEMHKELLRVICQFIHNSNHNSREKLVTELRKAHPEVASSRAAAMRELDRIAEKKRLPNGGGVVWFVKPEFLKKADLKDKDLNPPPDNQSSTPLPPKIMPKAAPSQKAAVVSPKQPRSDSPGKKRKQFVSSASANLFKNFLSKRQKTK